MNRRLRWLIVATLLLMMFAFITALGSASTEAATVQRAHVSTPGWPPCGPGNDGQIIYVGGNPYICGCVFIHGKNKPCEWVWRNQNPSATTFSYLEMDRGVLITTYGKANFYFQPDGNLVDYDEYGNARWASHTVGSGYQTIFQTDGNLVIYNVYGHPVWASSTCCYSGNYLSVQTDGNIVIYTWWGWPLWATGTNH